MLGSAKSIASGLRPPPKADVEALDKQLLTGEVEVNIKAALQQRTCERPGYCCGHVVDLVPRAFHRPRSMPHFSQETS